MHTTGLILAIFGGLLLFGSALALASMEKDERTSASDIFDMFFLGGVFGFFRNLVRGITQGVRTRSSEARPPCIVLGIALGLITTGFTLMSLSNS